jgi:hypothetical protein
MILIIPNISEKTSYIDIRNFVNPALKGFWPFTKDGKLEKIKITIFKDLNNNQLEYHALVYVNDVIIGNRLIRKLNKTKLLNKLVVVRSYEIRSWHNDRRANHSIIKDDIKGSRRSDRRRGSQLQEITDVSTLFTGVKEFARKL